jgi:hypothetical protein
MVEGATKILGDIPGKHLDPILLLESQRGNIWGTIMIIYGAERASPYFDLILFHQNRLLDCARITSDLRFTLSRESLISNFTLHRNDTRISLFSMESRALRHLRATLYLEPCLKIQVRLLHKQQIRSLLQMSPCSNGIVECNDFSGQTPRLFFSAIRPDGDLSRFALPFRNGRLLLYDFDKNRELIRERRFNRREKGRTNLAVRREGIPKLEPRIRLAIPPDKFACLEPGESIPLFDQADSTESCASGAPPGREHEVLPAAGRGRQKKSSRNAGARRSEAESGSQMSLKAELLESSALQDQVERLIASFRQSLLASVGERADDMLASAEEKIKGSSPGFSLQSPAKDDIPSVFDLIESVVAGMPFLKRAALREKSLSLISDLYNRHFSLLDDAQLLDKVEQVYYRLKK